MGRHLSDVIEQEGESAVRNLDLRGITMTNLLSGGDSRKEEPDGEELHERPSNLGRH